MTNQQAGVAAQNENRKIRLTLSPEAEKYVSREAPVSARRIAAGGALPLQPIELANVLFALMHDPDAEVKSRARASLESLPTNLLETILSSPVHPALLSFFAHHLKDDEAQCERIALNAATDDRTIVFLATLPSKRLVDIISNNQERLMRCEGILDSLGENPLTGRAVIDRILSFLGISSESEDAERDDLAADEDLSEEAAEAAVAAILGEEYAHLAKALASEAESDNEEVDESGNLFAAIQNMTVMQKIKLARSGGKEARGLLIRDRNKVVYTAVINSPKITITEVAGLTQNRNTPDEVLRIISNNRDYTKQYVIKLGLATNPKTPQPTAIKFLNYVQDKDLRMIMKSRDVPSNISAHARRMLIKKGKV